MRKSETTYQLGLKIHIKQINHEAHNINFKDRIGSSVVCYKEVYNTLSVGKLILSVLQKRH